MNFFNNHYLYWKTDNDLLYTKLLMIDMFQKKHILLQLKSFLFKVQINL